MGNFRHSFMKEFCPGLVVYPLSEKEEIMENL
jgi:hypothetical protein